MLRCYRIGALLRLGRSSEAFDEAGRVGLGAEHSQARFTPEEAGDSIYCVELLQKTHILIVIAGSAHHRATRLNQEALESARAQDRHGDQVELLLNGVVIALAEGRIDAAKNALIRAVGIAEPRKLRRPFEDRKAMLANLVLDTRPQDWNFVNDAERIFFRQICERLPVPRQAESIGEAAQTAPGSLTHREIEMLRLAQAGLTNAQMAERLEVSVSTVKWHLYNAYAKLGAQNRASAIAIAKSLSLLTE